MSNVTGVGNWLFEYGCSSGPCGAAFWVAGATPADWNSGPLVVSKFPLTSPLWWQGVPDPGNWVNGVVASSITGQYHRMGFKLTDCHHPSETVFCADGGGSTDGLSWRNNGAPAPYYDYQVTMPHDKLTSCNVTYLDGHVESVHPKLTTVVPIGPVVRGYWWQNGPGAVGN